MRSQWIGLIAALLSATSGVCAQTARTAGDAPSPHAPIVGAAEITAQRLGPGDVVVIPPHTAHGFVEISTKRILYTSVRIDSQKLLELRDQPR